MGLGKGTGKARLMPGTLSIQENPSLETSLGQPATLGSKHRRLCEPVSASPVPEAPRDWSCREGASYPCHEEAQPMNDLPKAQLGSTLQLAISTQIPGSELTKKKTKKKN